jgi:hypothetical protein
MKKVAPGVGVGVGAVAASLAASPADANAGPETVASPAETKSTPDLMPSAAATEIIDGKMKTIRDYSKYAQRIMGKEPFAKFPDHFKQDRPGPFSNFSAPGMRDPGWRINPQQQRLQQLQRLQQQRRLQQRFQQGSEAEPPDVQDAFDKFKPT